MPLSIYSRGLFSRGFLCNRVILKSLTVSLCPPPPPTFLATLTRSLWLVKYLKCRKYSKQEIQVIRSLSLVSENILNKNFKTWSDRLFALSSPQGAGQPTPLASRTACLVVFVIVIVALPVVPSCYCYCYWRTAWLVFLLLEWKKTQKKSITACCGRGGPMQNTPPDCPPAPERSFWSGWAGSWISQVVWVNLTWASKMYMFQKKL